eukprot:12664891-Alexandrium_andersonii.AAC.1
MIGGLCKQGPPSRGTTDRRQPVHLGVLPHGPSRSMRVGPGPSDDAEAASRMMRLAVAMAAAESEAM